VAAIPYKAGSPPEGVKAMYKKDHASDNLIINKISYTVLHRIDCEGVTLGKNELYITVLGRTGKMTSKDPQPKCYIEHIYLEEDREQSG